MPDKILDTVNASGNSNAPQHPPAPPLPPSVEGNEDGEGGDGKSNSPNIGQYTKNPKHWTAYVEAACAVLLVIITGTYTYYSARQTGATITAANAAQSAAETAKQSLALTKQIVESSEAAFVDWKVETISFHAQSASVVFTNSGHAPAKHIVGTVTIKRVSPQGKVLQSTVRPFTRSVIPPNAGFINEVIGMSTSDDLDSLKSQDIIAKGTISFDDGVKRVTQTFCSGMLVRSTGGPHWEDCENLAAMKKYLSGY